jgi:S-layer protein
MTPTTAQLAIIRLHETLFGEAVGATEMAAALPSFTGNLDVAANNYAASLISSTPALSILSPSQLFDKVLNNISASNITTADKTALRDALVAFTAAGLTVGATVNLLSAFLYNNADTLNNVWTNTANQVKNQVTVASYYTLDQGNASASTTVLSTVTYDPATVTAVTASPVAGQTFTLTTSGTTVNGTTGNDIINGSDTTLVLAQLNGNGGNDTLNYNDASKAGTNVNALGLSLNSIETVNVRSTTAALADTSGMTGVTNLNATLGTSATLVGASSTAVSASGISGAVTIDGGSSQTVTAGTGSGAITLGATKVTTGAISVTDTAQADKAIAINGGSTVDVTTTTNSTGTITIGKATAATGAVTVTETVNNAAAAATNLIAGAINVTGGTTVSVTSNATQGVMATASTNSTLTQAAVTVTGNASTTAVTVNQTAAVAAANTVLAAAGTNEKAVVLFGALKGGDSITLAGLTLTTAADMTAKQVATAFANLSTGAATGWTSGAVTGTNSDTVTFTATSKGNVANLNNAGFAGVKNGTPPTVITTDGIDPATAAGTGGIAGGAVTITDTKGTITTATLNGYGKGSSITSDALTSLSLSNSAQDLTVTDTKATTLGLTLNNVTGAAAISLDGGGNKTYTTLNITTATADSATNITAAAVTGLTVAGTNAVNLTGSTFTALKTVTVSGSAGVTGDFSGATVTDVNASATSGNVTATIDATKATYEGGTGNDAVTISAAPTKAISGGTGTDTLVLNVDSATFSNPSANTNISGFETLGLGTAATGSYDATGFSHLTQGSVTGDVTYTNVAAGTDLTITATQGKTTTYTLKDATGPSDALTINLNGAGIIKGNTVTAAGIESIAISATDTTKAVVAGATADSLTLVATSATSMTVTGNTTLTLDNSGNTKLTSVDASHMTGGLTYTTAGTVAETVKGGATTNNLKAVTGTTADVLIGGAANDTITANAGLDTLTGNGGNDTFVIGTAGGNVNTYSTITDANAGDVIQFKDSGNETFGATKVTLGDTAVFQDYANAVVQAGGNASTNAYVGWFQFSGNTYVVESLHDGTTTASFVNGTDIIVKLTGIVDLSHASLLQSGGAPDLLLA